MDKQSLFFTFITAIISTCLMLISISLITKKQKLKPEIEQKISISYSILFSSIMIAFFLFLKEALELIKNTIEIIISSKMIEDSFIAITEKIVIFIGFTFMFTFLSYYTVHNLVKLIMGKRDESIEIEKDNQGYFIIKATLLILLVFVLTPIFKDILEWYTIKIETPFYH